ncbi:MAG TPA: matrixin family metalloprotease, partial [Planctomycetota bacterium]|nr:matrixin family metalloprotease [Planctomycetota bacterium]
MSRWKQILAAALVSVLLLGALFAHVRLINANNGRLLAWTDPAHVGIAISSIGSDDIADESHLTAVQNAIAAWNASTGTTARLVEDASAPTRARTDWAADDLHLVFFDETGASGYFPSGSSTVALTPVWFTSNGRITDADILFNGRGFSFTTSKEPGAFDVQDVATHELGHLLGLDHSGVVGASLYPYVSPGLDLHRSIASDDEHGLRDAYPSATAASISGTVRRASDASAVGGAYVVVRSSAGRTIASTLADSAGAFR